MEKQLVTYDITDAAIHQMEQAYMGYTIMGLEDKEGFDMVHEARMVVKGKRIEVEKRRKELKADALAWGRKVDSEAKKIFKKLEPIENHLKAEEDKITEEKRRIKEEEERKEQERVQERIDQLAKFEFSMPFFEVAVMTDEEFNITLANAATTHEIKLAERAAEERIQKEKEETDRFAREAEENRLALERQRLKEIREEQEAEAAKIKAEQQRVAEERQALEDEKRKAVEEKERREREKKEKANREKADAKPQRKQHLFKLADAFFDNLEIDNVEFGGIGLDSKRPFGNSCVTDDILEIIGVEEPNENGYTDTQRDYADRLYREELIPFLREKWTALREITSSKEATWKT
jgi:phage-related minor tail protein